MKQAPVAFSTEPGLFGQFLIRHILCKIVVGLIYGFDVSFIDGVRIRCKATLISTYTLNEGAKII
jgi:hypothetical protein